MKQSLLDMPKIVTEPTTSRAKIIMYILTATLTFFFLALFMVALWPLLNWLGAR